MRLWKTLRNLLSVYSLSIPSHGFDDLVLFRRQDSLWTIGDILGHLYSMFMVHISHFSFLKAVLDVIGLGQPLWTKTTCYFSILNALLV